MVVRTLEQQQDDEAGKGGISQAIERPGLGKPRPSVCVEVRQPHRAGQLLGRLRCGRRQQPCQKRPVLWLEMAGQLGADEDIHRLATEVLHLTGRKAHDATSVKKDQDARDRCEKVRVDSENVRS